MRERECLWQKSVSSASFSVALLVPFSLAASLSVWRGVSSLRVEKSGNFPNGVPSSLLERVCSVQSLHHQVGRPEET